MALTEHVLHISADDLGMSDILKMRNEFVPGSPNVPRTPNIDLLATNGVYARNHWTTPLCSPTRGAWQTGRYPHRMELTSVVDVDATDGRTRQGEMYLPEYLGTAGVRRGHFGKWHLHDLAAGGFMAPMLSGYERQVGGRGGVGDDGINPVSYNNWEHVEDGVFVGFESSYNTTAIVDAAITWINSLAASEKWFASVWFNAPHSPYHEPPAALHTYDTSPVHGFNIVNAPDSDEWNAMIEAMDTEIGRLIGPAGLDLAGGSNGWTWANTTVIFASDNGTPGFWGETPFVESRRGLKASVSWAGTCVPWCARGAGVVGTDRRIDGLMHAVDLMPTVCDLMGVNWREIASERRPIDGVSSVPLLQDTSESVRDYVYLEERELPTGIGDLPDAFGVATKEYLFVRNHNFDVVDSLFRFADDIGMQVDLGDLTMNPAGLTAAQRGMVENMTAKLVEISEIQNNDAISPRFN